jgi:predicted DNA-binding transcriptional regulator AlpA
MVGGATLINQGRPDMSKARKLITQRETGNLCGGKSDRTIVRYWGGDPKHERLQGFPEPVRILGRIFFYEDEIEAFIRSLRKDERELPTAVEEMASAS